MTALHTFYFHIIYVECINTCSFLGKSEDSAIECWLIPCFYVVLAYYCPARYHVFNKWLHSNKDYFLIRWIIRLMLSQSELERWILKRYYNSVVAVVFRPLSALRVKQDQRVKQE